MTDRWIGGRPGARCGRDTKLGAECSAYRAKALQRLVFPSCLRHMTPLEKSTFDAIVLMDEVTRTEWHRNRIPACWTWSKPAWVCEVDDLDAVADWQDGRCAICGCYPERLVEDHDHVTGLVRGYLCRSCNTQEGVHQDGSWVFGRYRRKNPASILGVRAKYIHPFGHVSLDTTMGYVRARENLDASPAHDLARFLAEG